VFQIEQEHPEYVARKATWKTYRDLYIGGDQLRCNATQYLVRRQREPGEVYAERLNRVFYENYIGSIVDWYGATLFRREPHVLAVGPNEGARKFYATFIEDVDRKGTSLADFFRSQMIDALIAGTSYVLVDFPKAAGSVGSLAEEEALGVSRAYLVQYAAEDVINWDRDDDGNLEWVVLRTGALKRGAVDAQEARIETRWTYYDKENFRKYRRDQESGPVVLEEEGRHGLARLRQVPLFDLRIPQGMWLLNRAGSLQLEHFNKSNALSWALTMGLFAMPVVYSDREWSQMVGESYYIQLGPDDKFGWTEPEGKVYQIAADNLVRLQEEIYRVCYMMQAGASLDVASRQSALAKQRDFSITQEALRAFGDAAKEQIRRVLKAIEAARMDGMKIDVAGLDEFDIADFGTELEDAKALLALGLNSPTLKKEVFKKLALKYLCDARQDLKDQIVAEIEGA
jgi:hypothetical protein